MYFFNSSIGRIVTIEIICCTHQMYFIALPHIDD